MRVVFRMSAIVAALALGISTLSVTLSGCGQRGPLYMPTVPPLPNPPSDKSAPPTEVKPDAETASAASAPASDVSDVSDVSSAPLSLTPASKLGTAPATGAVPSTSGPARTSPQDQ